MINKNDQDGLAKVVAELAEQKGIAADQAESLVRESCTVYNQRFWFSPLLNKTNRNRR